MKSKTRKPKTRKPSALQRRIALMKVELAAAERIASTWDECMGLLIAAGAGKVEAKGDLLDIFVMDGSTMQPDYEDWDDQEMVRADQAVRNLFAQAWMDSISALLAAGHTATSATDYLLGLEDLINE